MKRSFGKRFLNISLESNIRFRKKVLFGVGLSVIASLAGGVNAVYNINKVEDAVKFSSAAASPLLIGVISLSESYQKLQSVFDPVMKNCAGLEGAERYLKQSSENQTRKLKFLTAMAEQADAAQELRRYEFSGSKIFKTRSALLDVCHRVTSAKARVAVGENTLRSVVNLIEVEVSSEIMEIEKAAVQKAEAGLSYDDAVRNPAFGPIQTSPASRRTPGALRNFYKLKILAIELDGLNTKFANAPRLYDLQRLRKAYWGRLEAIGRILAEAKVHFDRVQRADEYVRLQALVDEAKRISHTAPQSIFNAQTSVVQNETAKQALVSRLEREQGQYSVALLNIMDVAQRINRNAQLRTERQSISASWEIAISVFLSATLLLLTGMYFRRAVTEPLEALTADVSELAKNENFDDDPIDPALLARADEIGDLAKQFSSTFQALGKARSQLQEASRQELSIQRDRLYGAVENMPQALFMLDRDGKIIVANRRLYQFYLKDEEIDLVGMPVGDFIAICRRNGVGIKRTLSDDVFGEEETRGEGYQHSQRMVELEDGRIMTMTVTRLPDGGHVVTHEDITEKQAAQQKITHMALHDALTNLANRTLFRSHVMAQKLDAPDARDAALLYLDLDRFKIVNDTLGHPVGDVLLVQVAERLRGALGGGCFAARLGGDEFAILQTGVAQPEGALALAERIIGVINAPFDIEGHHIVIGTSVGIALAPRDGVDADELAKNADLALYCAKQEGRGKHRFFEPDMDRRMRDWREMEHDLREAINARQFELHYQPLVMLQGEKVVGFEALARWKHPRRGFVSPAEFIPVAEETGMICELGAWILEAACEMATRWPDDVVVAVNISPLQFDAGDLPAVVAAALGRAGLAPSRLMLEITEGVFLNDTDSTMAVLNELKALGVAFAMDDFGTGYSSLSYIRKFPFQKIKIDQSFVRGMDADPESIAIIRAVTNLCRDLGMMTTAEGVETAEQAAMLRSIGCEMAQGYFFGRPTPGEATFGLVEPDKRKIA
ncbi:EAL domain-containing protein [Rhizobium sp. TRM95796]|uniref:EAL domain-containing protein n=1 Tax=Rhizobium sp. TRM95796 TaxID=2979862 RepID=UPI0021E8D5C8|nr:EAL domain-containing protein [Rhizobium sp. TRM95796]MCV3764358.1 EAL domain-containing protein [Rhizobium sp. TRM95796]